MRKHHPGAGGAQFWSVSWLTYRKQKRGVRSSSSLWCPPPHFSKRFRFGLPSFSDGPFLSSRFSFSGSFPSGCFFLFSSWFSFSGSFFSGSGFSFSSRFSFSGGFPSGCCFLSGSRFPFSGCFPFGDGPFCFCFFLCSWHGNLLPKIVFGAGMAACWKKWPLFGSNVSCTS